MSGDGTDYEGMFGCHLLSVAVVEGTVGSLLAEASFFADYYPAVATPRCAEGLALALNGEREQATAVLRRVMTMLAPRSVRPFWMSGVSIAIELAVALGDRKALAELSSWFSQYSGQVVVISVGQATLGPTDYYLVIAALGLDNPTEAGRLFTSCLSWAERQEALAFVALCNLGLARSWRASGERDRSQRHARTALPLMERMGLAVRADQVRAHL